MGSNSIKCIPCGKNTDKSQTISKMDMKIMKNMDASCHAETGLLKRLFRNAVKNNKKLKLNKYLLIVIRYDKSGNLVNAKPCSICCPVIRNSGLIHIWYSYKGSFKYADGRIITGEDSSGTRMLNETNI